MRLQASHHRSDALGIEAGVRVSRLFVQAAEINVIEIRKGDVPGLDTSASQTMQISKW